MSSDVLTAIARTTNWACPNRCGNGVSRSDRHPTWHCWRCRVDAVEVEYVTRRADDYQGAIEALKRYAEHLKGCAVVRNGYRRGPDGCTCGLDAALAALPND